MEQGHESGLVEGNPWVVAIMAGIVIAILVLVSWRATRRLETIPGRFQGAVELTVGGLNGLVESIVGHRGRQYAPFVGTLFIYIACMNMFGLVPLMKSPTANLSMTVALAVTAILYVQVQAIRAIGLVNYVKHFIGEPWWLFPVMLPIHVIGEIAKPISLALRLFGNIFGEDTVLVILAGMSPFIVFKWLRILPVQFPMTVFAVFTSFVQALIFSVLTLGYLALFLGEHAEVES